MEEVKNPYAAFTPGVNTENPLRAQIEAMASEMVRLTRVGDQLDKEREQVKARFVEISETILPELMEKDNRQTYTSVQGVHLKVDEQIHASCPVASTRDQELVKRRSRLFKWLDDKGYGKIINRELKLTFDREQEELAKKVETDLKASNESIHISRSYSIHPSTLSKFVRDCLAGGVDIPTDVFGVHRRRVVKIVTK
jgi:hypothetical protein